jgi:hypothetical protein
MNGGKVTLIVVTMLALGVLVLPNTVSLFAGQHYWYNLSADGNQVPCQKCHADVFEELNNSAFHTHWGSGTYPNPGVADQYDCEACHRSNSSITYAKVYGDSYATYTPGKEAHAASVVACMLCHQFDAYNADPGVSEQQFAGFYAGGFNITDLGKTSPYDYSNETYHGHYEAHNAFVAKALDDTTLQDSNEACIACHTFVAVKINWTHARSLEFDVGLGDPITTDYGPHNWTVTNWSYNGTANAIVWGDTYGTNASTSYDSGVWPGEVPGVSYTYN